MITELLETCREFK